MMRATRILSGLGALTMVVVLPSSGHALPGADAQRGVTIAARPSIAGSDHPITLFGRIPSPRPGEKVEIQSKDCGHSFFRAVDTTPSAGGGLWTAEFFPGITTAVRAAWNGRMSKAIAVRQRALLRFAPLPSNRSRFVVSVVARSQLWRRYVVVERYDARRGGWKPYRRVVLTEQNAPGSVVWTSGEVLVRVPRGTLLRAVLPASQAGPCYLTSTSLTVRT